MADVAEVPMDSGAVVNEQTIAEAMELPPEQRPDWLPQKFRNAEDLAKAYRELERKFHTEKSAQSPEATQSPEVAPTEEAAPAEEKPTETTEASTEVSYGAAVDEKLKAVGLNPADLHNTWMETGGITEEHYGALEKAGFSRDMVDAYIRGASDKVAEASQGPDVGQVFEVVGGEKAYAETIQWAAANLSKAEINAYNKAVSTGDMAIAALAAQGLRAKYEASNGREPSLIQGGEKAAAVQGFKNRDEFQRARAKAMRSNDPRDAALYEQRAQATKWLYS